MAFLLLHNYTDFIIKPFLNKNFKYKDGKSSERLVKDLFNKFFQ